jgi:hypothetical protein
VPPRQEPKSFCRYASDYVASERLTKKQSAEIINKAGRSTKPNKNSYESKPPRITSDVEMWMKRVK